MDWLSIIRTRPCDAETMISALVRRAILAGIVFTGIRFLPARRSRVTSEPDRESATLPEYE